MLSVEAATRRSRGAGDIWFFAESAALLPDCRASPCGNYGALRGLGDVTEVNSIMHRICLPPSATHRLFALRGRFRGVGRIDPPRAAHIVINLQNAFLAPHQPLEIPTAREVVPNINRISKALRAAGGRVVHVQNTADAGAATNCSNYWSLSPAGRERIAACFRQGSEGHALWPALDLESRDLRLPKRHFSALSSDSSPLHVALQTLRIETLIITGTPTNICCESTARDAMSLGYKVIFVDDATAGLDDSEHNAALGNMLVMSADVMCTNEVLILIGQCTSRPSLSTVDANTPGATVIHQSRAADIRCGQATKAGD